MKFPTKFWKKKDKKEKETKKSAKDKKSKKPDNMDIKVEVKKEETVNGEILTPQVLENGAAVTPETESLESANSTEGTATDSATGIQPADDDTTKGEVESSGVETDEKAVDKVKGKEKKKKGGILSSVKGKKVEKVEKKRPARIEDPNSGVFIFGNKVEGKFKKVVLSLLAISLIPPTFLFGIALMMCVFLLLYPLMAFLVLAIFPTVVCSMFVLLALVPVLLPLVIIFLLITGKGKLSLYDEGKLVVLKFAKWAMPTI